jgi:hypothetical protein
VDQSTPWKRVTYLELWLCFFPPVGLILLWRDDTLTRGAKIRMLVYTYLIPFLIYFAISLYLIDSTQKAIQAGGGGF